jgi:predicted ester cyclase
MSAEQNIETAKRWINTTLNDHDLDGLEELIHAEFASPDDPDIVGPEGERAGMEYLLAAFPDFSYEIRRVVAEGDRVAVYGTARGTHKGEYLGVEPTGKSFVADSIDVLRFRDGKAIEVISTFDVAALGEQLGVTFAD